jgi:predicted esterase
MRKLLFGLMLLVCSYNSFSQQVARGLTAGNGQFIGFYEYKPTNYNHYGKKYPLIIFLHGIGERGNGTSELHKLTWHAIPRIIQSGGTMTYRNPNTGEMETFLVLSPQLSFNYGYWDSFYIDEMLKYAKQNLNVDPNRIYLTGLSAGGGGTWRYPSQSLTNAQQFAAIAPVCPTCDWNLNTLPTTIVAGKVAVWSFHANDDYTTSSYCTYGAVDAINTMNPATPAKKTIYPNGGHYIWEIVYTSNEVFEWFLGQSRGSTPLPAPLPNVAPVAKAGSDITISLPTNSTTLNNSGSYDPDGSITGYKWSQGSGPSTANIGAYTSASTSITSLVAGTYVFHLTVTDNAGATNVDEVVVTVNGAVNGQPPVANAGKDETIPVGQATVLNGNGSSASAGIRNVTWTKISGPAAFEILSPNSSETWIRHMTSGAYVFRLTVTDNNGVSSTDDVVINVGTTTPTTTPPPPPPTNTAGPVVNAGKDEAIPVGQATVLNGNSSTAAAGIRSFSWTKVAGPTQHEMLSPSESSTWIRNMVDGTYTYRLTVTDNNGVSAYDDVVIKVGNGGTQTAPPPPPPVNTNGPRVSAGNDQSVPAGQAVAVNGNNTTAAAGIRTMIWSKVSGPSPYEILAPYASETWIRNMVAGVYVFRLTVTDNNGVSAHDDMVITVGGGTSTGSAGGTGGPVANAGKDETIPVGQATVLHGETSTATAGIRSYAWTKVSGPSQYEMLTPDGNTTWIRNMVAGSYVYRLTVTDNNGLTSTDDVTINVFANSSTASNTKQLVTVSETSARTMAATQPVVSFQNPVRNNLNLNWDAAYKGNAKINIVDMNGKTLKTLNVRKNQQQYRNNIEVNGLKQGMFLVQIQTEDGKTITQKFVKK